MKVRVWRYLVAAEHRAEFLESAAAWERFQEENATAYAALGERLGHLTVDQQELV